MPRKSMSPANSIVSVRRVRGSGYKLATLVDYSFGSRSPKMEVCQ